MRGMRAYFEVPDGASLARLYIDDIEDGLNQTLSQGEGDEAVYDLSGRKINSHLSKGLYIHNGKMLLVK